MANLPKSLVLLTLFFTTLYAIDSIPAIEHKQVVEANHYYSDTNAVVNYTIQNVEKGRSLIFVLRNKQNSEESFPVEQNHINISLNANAQKTQCLFDSYDDLCVIKEIQQTANMTL